MTPNEQALGKEKLSSKQEETSNKKGSGNGSHLSEGFLKQMHVFLLTVKLLKPSICFLATPLWHTLAASFSVFFLLLIFLPTLDHGAVPLKNNDYG